MYVSVAGQVVLVFPVKDVLYIRRHNSLLKV